MYIRTDHYAYQNISDITQRAFEAGLFVKWSRDSKTECRRPVEDVNIIIRIEQIYASLFIYLLSVVISALLLLVEQFVHKKARIGNSKMIWVYADLFIDGDRHYFQGIRSNP